MLEAFPIEFLVSSSGSPPHSFTLERNGFKPWNANYPEASSKLNTCIAVLFFVQFAAQHSESSLCPSGSMAWGSNRVGLRLKGMNLSLAQSTMVESVVYRNCKFA